MAGRSILVLASIALAVPAGASPRSDPTLGRAVFTGATAADPSSIGLNPAALGEARKELYLAVAGLLDQLAIDRKVIDPATDGLIDGEHVTDHPAGAGAQIGFVWHPGSIFKLGIELRVPPSEVFPDDPAVRYHALGSRQRNYVATAGVSARVSSRFYLGFGVPYDVTRLRLRYARDTALDIGLAADCGGAECGHENPQAAELYDVDVGSESLSGDNIRFNIGLLVQPWDDAWLGIAYHSTPGTRIQSRLTGTMDVTRAPRDGGAALHGGSTVYVSYPASVDVDFRAPIYRELDLRVGGRWEDLSRMQAYDVRGYGAAFRGQAVPEWVLRPRGLHDAFALWGGVEQTETKRTAGTFRLGGRIGIETSALVPERTAPGTVSPTSLTLDAGLQVRASSAVRFQLSYGAQIFSRVSVERSDYDPRFAAQCADTGFDYSTPACEAVRNGYAIPTAAGDYTRIQHALRLGFAYEFP